MQNLFRGKVHIEISEYFCDAWIISLNSMSKINIAFPYFINGIDLKYVDKVWISRDIKLVDWQ